MRSFLVPLLLVAPVVYAAASDYQYASVVAIFVTVVLLWFTEALPLPVTGLLVPVLISLYGVMPAKDAFHSFGSDILFLFIGCFLLARAMQKHGWDKRMAYWVLTQKVAHQSPSRLILVMTGISWVMSMWVSNTATCAMLVPICIGIIEVFEPQFSSKKAARNFATWLLLACAFGATMGGLATPIGTPPNLLAIEFLRDAGFVVTFLEWMCVGIPVSLLMLAMLHVVLGWFFPVEKLEMTKLQKHFSDALSELGEIKREEIQVAIVFLLAVALWVTPGMFKNILGENAFIVQLLKPLTLSVVGVGCSLLLFLLPGREGKPNLTWEDAKEIDWGTVLLFGGGITLGHLLNSSGFAGEIGSMLFHEHLPLFLLIGMAVVLSVMMSEFASNTASAAVVYPILLGSVATLGLSTDLVPSLLMASAFGASFGFMLPVSTPPNAIVYGTGRLRLSDMVRAGVCFDLLGAIVITLWIFLLISLY